MATLKKYDLTGKEVGTVDVGDELIRKKVSNKMVKDYILAIRENKRQWSANTKGRTDVACTGKKPFAQKGTGNARQGYLASPQYKGGGIVFGPKPKFNQHVRINKKERRQAVQHLLSEKITDGRLHVLDVGSLKEPKTKQVTTLLRTLGIEGKRVLVLGATGTDSSDMINFVKSMRNIPRSHFMPARSASGYDLMLPSDIIVTGDAMDELLEVLGR